MRAYYFLALLLIGCGPDSGEQAAPQGKNATLNMSASASQIELGETLLLSWQSSDIERCEASGDWSGNKPPNGSEVVTPSSIGQFLFVLRCFTAGDASVLQEDVALEVVPQTVNDGPKSGTDTEDAKALFEHYHQYTQ